MHESIVHDIDAVFLRAQPIAAAIAQSARRALDEHKRLGYPIAESREGRVVWVPPEEIVLDDPPTQQ